MSAHKLLWEKIGHYNVFIVGTVEDDGLVFFPSPYRTLLETYLGLVGKKLPEEGDVKWFDGHTDLPAGYYADES